MISRFRPTRSILSRIHHLSPSCNLSRRSIRDISVVQSSCAKNKKFHPSESPYSRRLREVYVTGAHNAWHRTSLLTSLHNEMEFPSPSESVNCNRSTMNSPLHSEARQSYLDDQLMNLQMESTSAQLQELSSLNQSGKRSYHTSPGSYLNKRRRKVKPFDICESSFQQSASSFFNNKEVLIQRLGTHGTWDILRPGMVLLKNYVPLDEQVEIVRTCREVGLGEGGFYQPGYGGGAKLCLQMMCLGLDWDPQTKKYGDVRHVDGAMPPVIPDNFVSLVFGAIQAAHKLILMDISAEGSVDDILPPMHPNICIVNFYNTKGRLGLHQDKDESMESLRKGLPVVSISLGDSAEFLYGDQRDAQKAGKILLESGDVLVFGGASRHIFHGVSSIIPNSAPRAFREVTNLCPGRLNLTFREY